MNKQAVKKIFPGNLQLYLILALIYFGLLCLIGGVIYVSFWIIYPWILGTALPGIATLYIGVITGKPLSIAIFTIIVLITIHLVRRLATWLQANIFFL